MKMYEFSWSELEVSSKDKLNLNTARDAAKSKPRQFSQKESRSSKPPQEQRETGKAHLAGINSVVVLVGVTAAALGFVRHSFLCMVHTVFTSSPKGNPKPESETARGTVPHVQKTLPCFRHRAESDLITNWALNVKHRKDSSPQKHRCPPVILAISGMTEVEPTRLL